MRLPIKVATILSGGDAIAPTVVITSTETSPSAAATHPITITFSVPVTGFVVGDITVSGYTLSDFAGSGASYTVTATPTAIHCTIDIAAGVCVNANGTPNAAASQFTRTSILNFISVWTLNETTGNRLDSLGANNYGLQGTIGVTTGQIGNAATSSGATNHLLTAGNAALLAVDWSAGFSCWGWVKVITGWTGRAGVVSKITGVNVDWGLFADATVSKTSFAVEDSVSGESRADTTALTPDVWHFLAGRYNPSTKKAEIRVDNGAWVAASSALTNVPSNLYNHFATGKVFSTYANSQYDAVGVCSRYLSDADVTTLYNGGTGMEYPF